MEPIMPDRYACHPLNTPVPYSDLKMAVNSFIRQKWHIEWDGKTENKLKK